MTNDKKHFIIKSSEIKTQRFGRRRVTIISCKIVVKWITLQPAACNRYSECNFLRETLSFKLSAARDV